jgi:preprotein translocase subunit SecD
MKARRVRCAAVLICLLATAVARAQESTVANELRLAVDRTRVRVEKLRKGDASTLQEVLEKRVAALAGSSGVVEVKDQDEIRVRIPLEKVTPEQTRALTRPGKLEFRALEDVHSNLNPDGRYLIDVLSVQGEAQLRFRDRRSGRPISSERVIAKSPLLFDNDDLEPDGAHVAGTVFVRVRLNERATRRLRQFVKKPGRLLAIVLDGEILAINASVTPIEPPRKSKRRKGQDRAVAPQAEEEDTVALDVPAPITKPEEANLLVGVLNSGVLPYPLAVRSQRVVPN